LDNREGHGACRKLPHTYQRFVLGLTSGGRASGGGGGGSGAVVEAVSLCLIVFA